MRRSIQGVLAIVVGTGVVGCGPPGSPPTLDQVEDQVGYVGQELVIVLRASDPDGHSLAYSYDADVPELGGRAELSQIPGGAEFRWTPEAGDVGEWFFDFRASDGDFSDTITARVEVRSAVGESPIFREPLGSGTTLDFAQSSCIEFDVVVDAPTASQVRLDQEPPLIENAELEQTGGLTGVWSWCPSAGQIEQSDRYQLTLSADDSVNPVATKHYLIVLQEGSSSADCPGEAPTIEHAARDVETLSGLAVSAAVADPEGLKRAPILFYSHEPPADPPDLSAMNPVEMELAEGDRQDGVWEAGVPNPAADLGEGDRADVYYVITAQSQAEAAGKKCSNLAQAPEGSSYAMTVTNPGGSTTLALCDACTADAQCGGEGDLCARVGGASEASCLESCTDGGCPSGYTCSAEAVTSVGGQTGRQCIPDDGSCTEAPACEDDGFAPNQDPADAAELSPDRYDLVMCPAAPGDDQDWFFVELEEDSLISLDVAGGDHTDLDLWLFGALGGVIDGSLSFTSEENITQCLPRGLYLAAVVEAFASEENAYALTYETAPADCAEYCNDDELEDDDAPAEAREVSLGLDEPYEASGRICSRDSDFYAVEVLNGETISVELAFEQQNVVQDLDLRLYDDDETLLTPCSEDAPSACDGAAGQSDTSNEYTEFTVDDPGCSFCPYFIEVRGFGGAENAYDIRIAIESDDP